MAARNEDLIRELITIKDRSPESMTDADYDRRNNINQQLFGTVSLHDAFAKRYPEFCLATVIWMVKYGLIDKMANSDSNNQQIYSSNGRDGGIIRVHPTRQKLAQCLSDANWDENGIYLYFDGHSNIIWLDPSDSEGGPSIYRYDPQISSHAPEAGSIDSALRDFFAIILPHYTYYGNTLPKEECIQHVRRQVRGHLDCFCQEYTLLYAFRRLQGMSHQAACDDLVKNINRIHEIIADLYRQLAI